MTDREKEKFQMEIEEIRAKINKMMAESMKLQAETMKIQTENKWYPIIGGAALATAIMGVVKLLP